ncbi:MAG: hypothetical protein IT435_01625 [Phycisphaerales bacterium]|nr:hypothetical protein [Phycisphaerales bacterium]
MSHAPGNPGQNPQVKPDPRFEDAQRWYRALVERELIRLDQPSAVGYMNENFRLRQESKAPEGANTRLKTVAQQLLTPHVTRLNARTGELISWHISTIASPTDESMAPEQGMEIAKALADPPPQSVLVRSEYDSGGERSPFVVRWSHVEDGLPVEGDYIEVRINGKYKKAYACSRMWRQPNPMAGFVDR